jgi:hypothetical protein
MQIRKHISLFLAFFVLVSNSGLAFNVHYCEGKIAAISSVFSKEEVCKMPIKEAKSCCAKEQTTHKKCCSDKEVKLESKTEKVVIKTISFDLDSVFVIQDFNSFDFVFSPKTVTTQNVTYYCDANAPPLYKLYCQFTLFG